VTGQTFADKTRRWTFRAAAVFMGMPRRSISETMVIMGIKDLIASFKAMYSLSVLDSACSSAIFPKSSFHQPNGDRGR